MRDPKFVLQEVESLERQYRRPDAYNAMRNFIVALANKPTPRKKRGKKCSSKT